MALSFTWFLISSIVLPSSILNPAAITENNTTAFCYSKSAERGKYVLGFKPEGENTWNNVGNDAIGCLDQNLLWARSAPQIRQGQ